MGREPEDWQTVRFGRWGMRGPEDPVLLAYWCVVAFLIVISRERIPDWGWHVALHGAVVFLFLGISRVLPRTRGKFYIARFALLNVTVFGAFTELGNVIECIHPELADPVLIGLDEWIFGFQASQCLERWNHPVLVDLLQLAYCTYYFLPLALGIALYRKKLYGVIDEVFFVIPASFCMTYLLYILVPATGPRFNQIFQTPLHGLAVGDFFMWLLNQMENIKRDCYPSGHTMTTLIVLVYAFRYARQTVVPFGIITSLLIFSTVYLRYHYLVDVLAGAAGAVLMVLLGPIVCRAWYGRSYLTNSGLSTENISESYVG
ncbi:MAG: phosphatase PAP2 family protein [Planctomycetota bacterium]|nr:phosphatase PAP2 family protein [Planctomycetota bacterium]